ncbi:MAG: hypothetical protein HLUCCA01_12720 [Bacteroidetes bacterium HLUCCA01]|nr:MAG: hypothetical protein HLUCCA01_12720 [Bacteroidetes bacterium HLUCCA01]
MKKRVVEYLPDNVEWFLRKNIGRVKSSGKQKIFGIGANKTGTTSLKVAMAELGYTIGYQRKAELLNKDWAFRNFEPIIDYCKSAQFFQDVPFSKPFTYVVLDQAFPGSKFILTIRDSPEQWYNSITKFHAKKWGLNGRIPTKEDLMNATYIDKGRPWISNRLTYNTPENDPYNKEMLIEYYNNHNQNILEYFRHRPDDLLVINISEKGSYKKFCKFLNIDALRDEFPWKNKTKEVSE